MTALPGGQNHFVLFGLPARFNIDLAALDQSYRKIQAEVHPDRFASAAPNERLQSLQWATLANEAYQTLKRPVSRARYLLGLHGIDTQEDSNTQMPVDFLMLQMEWREGVEEASHQRSIALLEKINAEISSKSRELLAILEQQLDSEQNFLQATETVRKLRFLEKIQADIAEAEQSIEN